MEEVWKYIDGYAEDYQVSNLGRVRSFKNDKFGKLLSTSISHKGYERVRLYDRGSKMFSVHRLVVQAFISNYNNLPQVNHINGIKTDNRVENLEWCTNLENIHHARKNNLVPDVIGDNNPNVKINSNIVEEIINRYNSGETAKHIAGYFNITLSHTRSIIYGTSWKDKTKKITRRDDRSNWTEEHRVNSLKEKFKNGKSKAIKPVEQYTLNGNKLGVFRSLNDASISTGVPRTSINSYLLQTKFYNKDKTSYITLKHAGGFIWKYADLTLSEFLKLCK